MLSKLLLAALCVAGRAGGEYAPHVVEAEGDVVAAAHCKVSGVLAVGVADGTLELWSTRDPLHPTRAQGIANFTGGAVISGMVATARKGVLAVTGPTSITLLNASNPTVAVVLATATNATQTFRAPAAQWPLIYTAGSGMNVVNASTVGTIEFSGVIGGGVTFDRVHVPTATSLSPALARLVIAANAAGLYVYDKAPPHALVASHKFAGPTAVAGLATLNNYILVAGGDGVDAYSLSGGVIEKSTAYPSRVGPLVAFATVDQVGYLLGREQFEVITMDGAAPDPLVLAPLSDNARSSPSAAPCTSLAVRNIGATHFVYLGTTRGVAVYEVSTDASNNTGVLAGVIVGVIVGVVVVAAAVTWYCVMKRRAKQYTEVGSPSMRS